MNIYTFRDPGQLTGEVCKYINKIARKSIQKRGFFSLVLSGGKTPKALYEKLSEHDFRATMPWRYVNLFWTDERYVTKDHPESNYGMAFNAFISKVPLPEENIFPIETEIEPIQKAALLYEETLRAFFNEKRGQSELLPSFDLILLGLGKDGHVASLYQGSPVLKENKHWVRAVDAPDIYKIRKRITLTLPVINNARNVLFLVTGGDKKAILKEILKNKRPTDDIYPAQIVKPSGNLLWFTDIEIKEN